MRHILAVILAALIAIAPARPALAEGGGGGGNRPDPVVRTVEHMALALTFNQLTFTPSQIILMMQDEAFAMLTTGDVKRFVEGDAGLFNKLFQSNKQKIFEELERQNFVNKVGKAYRIGDMVFVDSMFFDTEMTPENTEAGMQALQAILAGDTFVTGAARDPLTQILATNIAVMAFVFRQSSGMRTIYQLEPKVTEAGTISGIKTGNSLNHHIAYLAFFAALAIGEAEYIGDVWQIEGSVYVAAPLNEIFVE